MKEIVLELNHPVTIDDFLCVAIGFFDGLHQGHQALIEEVKRIAKDKGLKSAVMTFDQHPLTVLKGEKEFYLISPEDRKHLLEEQGIDYLFVIHFTHHVAKLEPQAFIKSYLENLHVMHLVCGFDFHFGYHNSGNVALLEKQSFALSVVPAVMYDESQKVSSSLIKEKIAQGDVEEAKHLLGRPFAITGKVIHGKQRGRKMGFPTANVDYRHYFLPSKGVYGVNVQIGDHSYQGMANIGMNPTFDDIRKESLEVNIFDFDEEIYGEVITVSFKIFVRPERSFASMEDLKHQLMSDHEKIQKALNKTH